MPMDSGEATRLPRQEGSAVRRGQPSDNGLGIETVNRSYTVYIMTNMHNTVLYTGVANDLKRRAYQHRTGQGGGLTSRYNVSKLVYYEVYGDVPDAIAREKQIKGGSRQKKCDLVNAINPEWEDLYEGL